MDIPAHQRLPILGGIAVLLLLTLVVRWIHDWGLVTVHVKNAPLGKVVSSIARQGHVAVETSLDPAKPVTLDVDRVTVAEAVDALALRSDASWRLVYLAAPTKPELQTAINSLKGSGKLDDWITYFYPAPPFLADGGQTIDPRSLSLTMAGPELALPQLLNEAAQKSGVMTAFPKDWSPGVSRLPKPDAVSKAIPALVQSARGKSTGFFFLSERGRRGQPPGESQPPPEQEAISQLPPMNPEWMEQRGLAQIAHLPPQKQAEAKQELAEHKAFFAEMRKLSPEERRAKMKALMTNPDFIDKMADRRMMRDAKMGAEQRISRAVNYLNRKAAVQSAGTH